MAAVVTKTYQDLEGGTIHPGDAMPGMPGMIVDSVKVECPIDGRVTTIITGASSELATVTDSYGNEIDVRYMDQINKHSRASDYNRDDTTNWSGASLDAIKTVAGSFGGIGVICNEAVTAIRILGKGKVTMLMRCPPRRRFWRRLARRWRRFCAWYFHRRVCREWGEVSGDCAICRLTERDSVDTNPKAST